MNSLEWINNLKEDVRGFIGENHKSLALTIGGLYLTVKLGPVIKGKIVEWRTKNALKKWENSPRDVVILHTLRRGRTVPNLSPFAMKLETYLRMAKIPHEVDFEVPWGPVGKTPWITLNGEHICDSQIIIDRLRQHYDIQIGNYSEEQQAIGRTVRIMMDEYLYWGVGLWRYVYSEGNGLDKIFDMPSHSLKIFYKEVNKRLKQVSWAQGIGRHPKEQVISMMKEVIQTSSLILGKKKFLLGDEPSEWDCSFFGFMSMIMYAAPGSPYESYLKEECPNLKEYCNRMKTTFWNDWDQCLAQ